MIRGYLRRLALTLTGEFPEQADLDAKRDALKAAATQQRDEMKAKKVGPWAPARIVVDAPNGEHGPARVLKVAGRG